MANFDETVEFVNNFKPAVLCLSETHLTKSIEDHEVYIEGYKAVRVDSHTGGVMCYIHQDIEYNVIEALILEQNYWIVVINLVRKNLILACLYHSPNSSHGVFLRGFEDWYVNLRFKDRTVVILGDFNINWNGNEFYSKKLKVLVNDLGLKQLVKDFTHVQVDSKTIIDLLLTNGSMLKSSIIDEPRISNHRSIVMGINNVGLNDNLCKRVYKFDRNNCRENLKKLKFDYKTPCLSKKCNMFIQDIRGIIDKSTISKNIKVKINKPWFNNEIRNAIRIKTIAYREFLLNSTNNNWNLYRDNRNYTANLIKTHKRKFYESTIEGCRGDPKMMWKNLKKLIKGESRDSIEFVKFDGDSIYDQRGIAENFNKYFINSIRIINESIPVVEDTFIVKYLSQELVTFKLIDKCELKNALIELKTINSPDRISLTFLMEFFDEISDILLHLINSSLETGNIPEHFRTSTVVPIRKVEGTHDCAQFRPINMLPVLEKILEKIVYKQIMHFVMNRKLLSEFQSGFRERHSCETALQTVLQEWRESVGEGNMIGVLFLDLKRAFETIDRDRMLKKLYNYGFRETVYLWLNNYLNDRKQNVKFGDCISTDLTVELGVPQGSILGPLLFIIYVNDIVEAVSSDCKIHLFADDTVLYVSNRDINVAVNNLQKNLDNICKWLAVNRLKINVDKTKLMILGNGAIYNKFRGRTANGINIEGELVELVESYKYLGIVVDRKLKFKDHTDYICKKISKKLGFLYRVRKFLSTWTCVLIFNTIIKPHFVYCSSVLYLLNEECMERLQKLQNRSMRCILKCNKYTRIADMLDVLQWLNVRQMCEYHAMIFIHKLVNNRDLGLNRFLSKCSEIHKYNTRKCGEFYIKSCQKSSVYNTLFIKGLNRYNKVISDVGIDLSLNSFRIKLKQLYKNE